MLTRCSHSSRAAALGVWLFGAASFSPASTVSGEVRRVTAPNDPIDNARVTLFDTSLTFFREQRTDSRGAYSFNNVPKGSYQLGVAALRFEYAEDSVVVNAGGLQRDFFLGSETEPGYWEDIGNTLPEFLDATDIALLMTDGRILYCHDTTDPIIFNPVTGDKSFPPSSGTPQGCMNGSLLSDGRIILVGGQDGSSPGNFRNAVRWVKAFDATRNTWTQLPELQHPVGRWYTGMARLADGSLLALGGGTRPNASRTETCERLDLSTMQWSYTGSMLNPSEFSPSALLFTGEVLATWSPPQLYDPGTGIWRATGGFVQPNRGWPGHSDHSLVVLEDGRVLAMGVRGSGTAMGEIYEPQSESWSTTSSPDLVRWQCEVAQLPDGHVLVAGGEAAEPGAEPNVLGIVARSDLYDPGTDSWRRAAQRSQFAEYHAVSMLVPDGRVVITGGTRIKFQVGPTSADVEAFVPPYLLRGVRPKITGLSSTAPTRGSELSLEIFPDTRITRVVLMGTSAATHWVDGGIPRRLVLPVARNGSTVVTTLPTDPNVLPLGHYMLFAMVDDIPSVATMIRIDEADLLLGDLNCDGTFNGADIDPFFLALGDPAAYQIAFPNCDPLLGDMNGDRALNGGDIDPFFACLGGGVCP